MLHHRISLSAAQVMTSQSWDGVPFQLAFNCLYILASTSRGHVQLEETYIKMGEEVKEGGSNDLLAPPSMRKK